MTDSVRAAADPALMARALRLAALGRYSTFPNPRVGCIIVADGEIVGEGWHERAGEPHAEVFALRAAGERARGADVYVTLEPCAHTGRTPPCVDALIAAGVGRVIAAMQDPNPQVSGRGLAKLQAAGIATEVGLLQAEAERLNRGFVSRMTRRRPFVSIKLGASLDGRTGMASGESQWITAVESRRDVHRLRAEAGAVLTGSMTVLADDPRMTVRDFVPPVGPSGVMRQPDRIVLDTHARTPETARIWATDARRFWLTVREPRVVPEGVERIAIPFDGERLDLDDALEALSAFGINEVLAECGPVLAGALLRANLVDELVVYLAPALLGADARGLAVMPGLDRLDERIRLRYTDVRQIGPDIRITSVPETAPRKS